MIRTLRCRNPSLPMNRWMCRQVLECGPAVAGPLWRRQKRQGALSITHIFFLDARQILPCTF